MAGPTIAQPSAANRTPPLAVREKVDFATIGRIKTEAAQHSQVMDLASGLTDVFGARLTGSPSAKAAGDWAMATMKSWGLSNVHLEPWAYNRRGWTSERFAFRAVAPRPFVIDAMPSVWSVSTKGAITGPAIRFDPHSLADMQQRFGGNLKGACLLMEPARPTPAHFEPQATRLTDAELDSLAAGQPLPSPPHEVVEIRYAAADDAAARRWLVNAGVAALIFPARGDGGTMFLGSGAGSANKIPDEIPSVNVSAESYGRVVRILEKNIPVTLELDMQNTFYDNLDVSNIIAEIPGTDPRLRDEVVMIGAHLDSWTPGTGATDDAAGVAVMMEAMRILKVMDLQPRRTIRIGLWTGEEQGGRGSKAYVQQHFRADSSTARREAEAFSVYFNLDAGTGKIRGIYQQGNATVGPVFDAWMAPFKDLGMKTVSPLHIGGSDRGAFEAAGLPSFGFIQDPIEYDTRTHHTNADVYERLQSDDLKFNSAVLAAFAWQAAQRDEKMPRGETGKDGVNQSTK